ncbi:MAG: hypothetical protein HWE08_10280 [Alphaproteobacteria bacterium]|nr:hypothetical protein [Alphaproteobacteria bacterium]
MTDKNEMPEWDDLQQLWQDSPDVDMTKLAKHARFVWWRMRLNFAVEVAMCLLGIGFFGWQAITKFAFPDVVMEAFFVVLCAAGIWGAFYIRRGAWGEPDGSALSLVELQIRRAKSAIRYIVINNWGCLAGMPVIALTYWVMYSRHGNLTYERSVTLHVLMGGMAAVFVLFPILTRPYVRKKKQQILELERLAEQLKQADDEA